MTHGRGHDRLSVNHPLRRNLMPRRNEFYREGATSNFLVPGGVNPWILLDAVSLLLNDGRERGSHLVELEGVRLLGIICGNDAVGIQHLIDEHISPVIW